ncbi:MAG: glycosyltransferase family 4 protein [Bacteroidetes bacterium]|nr:glycosyltransferase family 4 protein [Bacteroidota bacterium]
MRILLVSNGYIHSTYGGGQVYFLNLVDALLNSGLEIFIASHSEHHSQDDSYKGVPVIYFNRKGPETLHFQIDRILKKVMPDLVHAHSYKEVVTQACAKNVIPCIVTAHHGGLVCPAGGLLNQKDDICRIAASSENCLPCVLRNVRSGKYWYPMIRKIPLSVRLRQGNMLNRIPFIPFITPIFQSSISIISSMQRWKSIAENTTFFVAPSYAIKESMIRNGADPLKIRVIPHGIPMKENAGNDMRIAGETGERKNGKVKFYYAGRICHAKGIHLLLEAYSGIEQSLAELHIIGAPEVKGEIRYHDRLRKKYRKLSGLFWHGKVSSGSLPGIISQYDVLVHPAIYLEVFGLTISEALSLEKPVISTRCGGAEMQLRDGENGLLIEPNDAAALGEAMKRVIENPDMFDPFKGRLKQQVIPIEKHASDLISLYGEVFSGLPEGPDRQHNQA